MPRIQLTPWKELLLLLRKEKKNCNFNEKLFKKKKIKLKAITPQTKKYNASSNICLF